MTKDRELEILEQLKRIADALEKIQKSVKTIAGRPH
jgi:hypothetical protein